MTKRLIYWLWGVAEERDFDGSFPRPFWRWLLRWCDHQHGYGIAGEVGPDGLGANNCDGGPA